MDEVRESSYSVLHSTENFFTYTPNPDGEYNKGITLILPTWPPGVIVTKLKCLPNFTECFQFIWSFHSRSFDFLTLFITVCIQFVIILVRIYENRAKIISLLGTWFFVLTPTRYSMRHVYAFHKSGTTMHVRLEAIVSTLLSTSVSVPSACNTAIKWGSDTATPRPETLSFA